MHPDVGGDEAHRRGRFEENVAPVPPPSPGHTTRIPGPRHRRHRRCGGRRCRQLVRRLGPSQCRAGSERVPSQHQHERRDGHRDQRRVPRGQPRQPFQHRGFRRGPRGHRTGRRHQFVRQGDQRQRRDQRAQDPPHHRLHRSDQRRRDAGPVQGLDRGDTGRLRHRRRPRDMVGRQSAVHHPGRVHAVYRRVDHGHGLDPDGRAVPVVDRARPSLDPRCPRVVGRELRSAQPRRSRSASSAAANR